MDLLHTASPAGHAYVTQGMCFLDALCVLCKVVNESGTEDILKAPGLHHLLLSALLEPQALGIPHLEDQSCRLIALQAKVKPALRIRTLAAWYNALSCGPKTPISIHFSNLSCEY